MGVAGIVGARQLLQPDHLVNDGRIEHRAITGEAHDDIRRQRARRVVHPCQNVTFAAAIQLDAVGSAPVEDRVVPRLLRCGHANRIDPAAVARRINAPLQDSAAGNFFQHLAGQPAGTHPCLDEGHHAFRSVRRHRSKPSNDGRCSFARPAGQSQGCEAGRAIDVG